MKDAIKSEWRVRPLGEVITLNYGKALARSERDPTGSIPVYGANGVMDWSEHTLTEGPSLVIGRKGSAGEVTRVDGPFWPSDVTYYTTHDHNVLDFDFLHYTLQTLNLPSMARGVKPGINRNDVYSLPIPLPPLEEQQRIVAVLDEAFEGLARARAHAEANLQNARELFAGTIASEFAKIESLAKRRVGDVAEHSLGKMLDKNKNKGTPRLYLRNVNVRWFAIDISDLLEMRITDAEVDRYTVRKGDLLICEGGYPGRSSIWEQDNEIFFQKALHRVRFDNKVYSRLLMYFLFMSDQVGTLKEHCSGAGIQHFTGQSLAKFEMPFPSLSVAKRMISTIEAMHRSSTELEGHFRQKLEKLDDLRQSLLQKAFAGELT